MTQLPICVKYFALLDAHIHLQDMIGNVALRLPRTEYIIQQLLLFVTVELFREQVTIDCVGCVIDMAGTSFLSDLNLISCGGN